MGGGGDNEGTSGKPPSTPNAFFSELRLGHAGIRWADHVIQSADHHPPIADSGLQLDLHLQTSGPPGGLQVKPPDHLAQISGTPVHSGFYRQVCPPNFSPVGVSTSGGFRGFTLNSFRGVVGP